MAYKDLIPYNNMNKWMSENGGPEKAVNLIQKQLVTRGKGRTFKRTFGRNWNRCGFFNSRKWS